MKKKTKKQTVELVSFKARVVEIEAYKTLVQDETLYHAVLDSLPDEPRRQAQFFGLEKNIFSVGDVHVVTFSRPIETAQAAKVREVVMPEKGALPN